MLLAKEGMDLRFPLPTRLTESDRRPDQGKTSKVKARVERRQLFFFGWNTLSMIYGFVPQGCPDRFNLPHYWRRKVNREVESCFASGSMFLNSQCLLLLDADLTLCLFEVERIKQIVSLSTLYPAIFN